MKKCIGCLRFQVKTNCGMPDTYHCFLHEKTEKTLDDVACEHYFDKAEYEKEDIQMHEEIENKRKEMWAIYSNTPPIKLIFEKDYEDGVIPVCPVCQEMPYSTEQCYWCGQRFIQDAEVLAYASPDVAKKKCPKCGGVMIGVVSKYNGHFRGNCQSCDLIYIE